MAKRNFTKAFLGELPLPAKGKRDTYHDSKARGLCVIVQPTGLKTFYVLRKIAGKTERFILGRFPDTSIEQARKRAGEINSRVDGGENPNEVKRTKSAVPTLAVFFVRYMNEHCIPHNRRPANTATQFKLLKKIEGKQLCDITPEDIRSHMDWLSKSVSPVTANKAHAIFRAVYNKALDWRVVEGTNPAQGIKRYREKSRERFLLPNEVAPFLESLEQESQLIQDFIRLLIYTGARRREVQSMEWKHINFEMSYWGLPDAKNGEARNIPLILEALELLVRRKSSADCKWVFPSDGGSVSGHLEEPKKAWKRILVRAGVDDLRIHDLRRTLGSWMTSTGANLQIVGKALGHKSLASTEIYARLQLDPVREAAQTAVLSLLNSAKEGRDD
tara:strand:- start:3782 stop:4945 length:1164 start_codon:yes stop_codon:yes gene_type:complete